MKKIIEYYTQARPEVAVYIPQKTKTILDIGCGQGVFLKFIKQQIGAETWGIEVQGEVAEKAKECIDHVLIGKIEDQIDSIPDNYFDCITFNDVLEHLLEPTMVLQLIKPKLSKEGVIVTSIPNVRYIHNLYELLVLKDWEYKDWGILDSTHFRFFTRKSMKRMFEDAGYTLLYQKGINETDSKKFKILNFLTFGLLNDTKYLQFVNIAKIDKEKE